MIKNTYKKLTEGSIVDLEKQANESPLKAILTIGYDYTIRSEKQSDEFKQNLIKGYRLAIKQAYSEEAWQKMGRSCNTYKAIKKSISTGLFEKIINKTQSLEDNFKGIIASNITLKELMQGSLKVKTNNAKIEKSEEEKTLEKIDKNNEVLQNAINNLQAIDADILEVLLSKCIELASTRKELITEGAKSELLKLNNKINALSKQATKKVA